MDTSDFSNLPGDPLDAAAYWFTRDHGGLMTAGERRRFQAWRQADPAHERAYQEILQILSLIHISEPTRPNNRSRMPSYA